MIFLSQTNHQIKIKNIFILNYNKNFVLFLFVINNENFNEALILRPFIKYFF